MKFKTVLGLVLIVVGAVLAIFFWDLHIQWFQGGPFGLLLIGLGVWDLIDEVNRSRGRAPKGLGSDFRELKEDIMGTPTDGDSNERRTKGLGDDFRELRDDLFDRKKPK